MPIYASAYKTTIGRAINIDKVRHEVENLQVSTKVLTLNYADYMAQVGNKPGGGMGGLLTVGTAAEVLIKHFSFPLVFINPLAPPNSKDDILVIGNARSFMSQSRGEAGRCRVVNTMEFELLRVMMAANLSWVNDGTQKILGMGDLMQKVYCRWISGVLRNRFELSNTANIKLRVICAFFFQCLFTDEVKLNDSQRKSMIASACRAASADFAVFETMLSDIDVIQGLDDLVAVIKEKVDEAIQLDNLDSSIVIEQMMSTWQGFDGRLIAAAAIEHPPTFAAMLYMSFGQHGYRKSRLGQLSEEYRGNKGGSDFIRNMELQLGLA